MSNAKVIKKAIPETITHTDSIWLILWTFDCTNLVFPVGSTFRICILNCPGSIFSFIEHVFLVCNVFDIFCDIWYEFDIAV